MTALAIGLASGIGNAVFMLPAIRTLKEAGHDITLYVQTDARTAGLWHRCCYVDEVLEAPAELNGHIRLAGQWRPPDWNLIPKTIRYQLDFPYRMAEWKSNMRLAEHFGCRPGGPDVSDWCRNLDRTPRWDVGIVPGSKPGVWIRKRWPGMARIAAHFLAQGKRVAVFGRRSDGVAEIPGDQVDSPDIAQLPDLLAGCRVIVGTDSGVTHLASSLGIPAVVVFTATSEIKGEPLGPHRIITPDVPCRPCQSLPTWNRCMTWNCHNIESGRVIQAAEELLDA